jgi:trehalose synthase
VILTLKEFAQDIDTPQVFFAPAIDPFSIKNRELSEEEMRNRLDHYGIPVDLPLVVQISRFDRWKDPEGVIRAFRQARKEVDCTLVLLGNVATDDPEGYRVSNRCWAAGMSGSSSSATRTLPGERPPAKGGGCRAKRTP